jgi:hexulose-6-phosphate isomerase
MTAKRGWHALKKGINILSFPTDMTLRRCIELAAQAGFDGIELGMRESGELSITSTADQIKAIQELAANEGVEISGLVAPGLYGRYPFTSSNKTIRQQALELTKRHLATAAQLNVDVVLMITGGVGPSVGPGKEEIRYDQAFERSVEAFAEVGRLAHEAGVIVGVENVWNNFLVSPLDMTRLVDEIGNPFVRAYLDVGNVVLFGFPEQWIRILGKRIARVHVKDFKKSVGTINGFVDLLEGDVNWPSVMAALSDIGYDDYLTVEMSPLYPTYPEQRIFNTAASLERILHGADMATPSPNS